MATYEDWLAVERELGRLRAMEWRRARWLDPEPDGEWHDGPRSQEEYEERLELELRWAEQRAAYWVDIGRDDPERATKELQEVRSKVDHLTLTWRVEDWIEAALGD